MLIAYWHMFTTGETYRDLGGDYFQRRDPERPTNASSPSSKPSDTTSRSNQPPPDPERHFPSVFLAGEPAHPGRVKMVEDRDVVR